MGLGRCNNSCFLYWSWSYSLGMSLYCKKWGRKIHSPRTVQICKVQIKLKGSFSSLSLLNRVSIFQSCLFSTKFPLHHHRLRWHQLTRRVQRNIEVIFFFCRFDRLSIFQSVFLDTNILITTCSDSLGVLVPVTSQSWSLSCSCSSASTPWHLRHVIWFKKETRDGQICCGDNLWKFLKGPSCG